LHYPTKYELERKLIGVRKLLNQGETCKEISKKMNLSLRTAERYIQRVHEQDKESWSSLATESLEHRALMIKSHYEKLARISEEILHDESKSPKERIEAGKTMIACHNNIYNMLKYGPLKLPLIETKILDDKNDS
jgi:IS30 family transposase